MKDKTEKKELIKQTGISLSKGIFGIIPYVGAALDELIFGFRGRIKQDRLNTFVLQLSKFINDYQENEINIEKISSSDFLDFFEEVLMQVSKTESDKKRTIFATALINKLTSNYSTDYQSTFLRLITILNIKQIFLLQELMLHSSNIEKSYIELESVYLQINGLTPKIYLGQEMQNQSRGSFKKIKGNPTLISNKICKLDLGKRKNALEVKLNEIEKSISSNAKITSTSEYIFLINELIIHGLVYDLGKSTTNDHTRIVRLSEIGLEFYNFIKERRTS